MLGLDLQKRKLEADADSAVQKELEDALSRLLEVDPSDEQALEKLKAESRRVRDMIEKRPDWGVSERLLRALP